jgi:hypothetical protein
MAEGNVGWFSKPTPLARVEGSDIHLDQAAIGRLRPSERPTRALCDEQPVIRLSERAPRLTVWLGPAAIARFRVDPIASDPDLAGKYFHTSIRILDNLSLWIDGLIATDAADPQAGAALHDGQRFTEGVRFQPLFIGPASGKNATLAGRGLFERGIHTSGTVTPGSVRVCCVCDRCGESFGLSHFHTGFGEGMGAGQYFYCARGVHTLMLDAAAVPGCPRALQPPESAAALAAMEAQLPRCRGCGEDFRYLHALRCPACAAPYLDFERFPQMRPNEYYGCLVVGHEPQHL